MGKPLHAAALAAMFAMISGCGESTPEGPSPEEIRAAIEKHRKAAEAKLAVFEELGKKAAEIPPLERDKIESPVKSASLRATQW